MTKAAVTNGEPVSPTRRRGERVAPSPALAQRQLEGVRAREAAPLGEHSSFVATPSRSDPVALLGQQDHLRVAELLPVRYGRMVSSPFAFYRGAAQVMAADLASTPSSGLPVQLCGDAHLGNFGFFASPERRLLFDLNDFDETLPGPFEWDVKRLAASLEIAARSQSFRRKESRAIVVESVRAYREAMAGFAVSPNQAVWYARLDADGFLKELRAKAPARALRTAKAVMSKATTRDSMQALRKLTVVEDGQPRIVADPPLIVPIEAVFPGQVGQELFEEMGQVLRSYRASLVSDRQHLLDQYRFVHMARKVVGVGSVGTRAWILLLEGLDSGDPLFLQAKQAQSSVLEPYLGRSEHANHGERVVAGQRLLQAASDIFLGWQRTNGPDGVDRDYYLRQLRDWKASAEVEGSVPRGMAVYARMCGWTLARAHARSGDRVAIASYLGDTDAFDQAVATFAHSYADQNELDHAALRMAIDQGRIAARVGV